MAKRDQAQRGGAKDALELLLFRVGDEQTFGIDVSRVREVVRRPTLRHLPDAGPSISGVVTLRGSTFAVTDTALAIGKPALDYAADAFVIVVLHSEAWYGLLVSAVERIIQVTRDALQPAPTGITPASYLVAVVTFEDVFVEIIDFDRILSESAGAAASGRQPAVPSV